VLSKTSSIDYKTTHKQHSEGEQKKSANNQNAEGKCGDDFANYGEEAYFAARHFFAMRTLGFFPTFREFSVATRAFHIFPNPCAHSAKTNARSTRNIATKQNSVAKPIDKIVDSVLLSRDSAIGWVISDNSNTCPQVGQVA
jgi:hypothetical protein